MKKKRGKKIYIIIGIAAALAVILFFPLRRVYRKTLPRKKNGIKQLEFAAGQRLTGYDVRDESGKWIDVSKISDGDAAVVAFNLKGCPDCKEDAFSQQILMNLYQTPDFNFYIIYDDDIPDEEWVTDNSTKVFSAGGRYKFTKWVPTYFLLDKDDNITKETIEASDLEYMVPNVSASAGQINSLSGGLPILIGLDGCLSCKEAEDAMVEQYGSDFLYVIEGQEIPEYKSDLDYVRADPGGLLLKALDLESLPVLVTTDADGNINITSDFTGSK